LWQQLLFGWAFTISGGSSFLIDRLALWECLGRCLGADVSRATPWFNNQANSPRRFERLLRGKIDKVTNDQLTLTTRLGSVKVSLDKKTKITALRGVKEVN